MATIKNIIQTIFTTQGANSTTREIDHLGRAQTRLGQSSASAGRSFATQSQGLGGLVAAYAGAAATTFALQQAFDKLSKSARVLQTLEGLNTLAAKSVVDGRSLLKNVQELTKYQLSLAATAEQINLALSAGFDDSQIKGLSTVALKASRALGRDLADAMTRVTRGSAKMETELLDELGIYTKIGPATRSYALSIGKAADELTEYERRQAFVNAVITEGNKKFAAINTTIPTTAEKIEAFGTKIIDLATKFGMVIANLVAPALDFLTNNVSAGFSAFGLIASMVAGKGISVFREQLDKTAKSMTEFGNVIERKIATVGGSAQVLRDSANEIRSFNEANMRLNFEEKAQYAAIKKTAEARQLNKVEIKTANDLLGNHIAKLNTEKQAIQANYQARFDRVKAIRAEQQALRQTIGATKTSLAAEQEKARMATSTVDRAFANASAASLNHKLIDQQNQLVQKSNQLKMAVSGARAEYTRISGPLNTVAASISEASDAQNTLNTALGSKFIRAGALASQAWSGLVKGASAFTGAITSVAGKAMGLFQFVTIFNLIGSSIANLLGKSQQYEAFVAKVGSTARNILMGERSLDFSNVAQGLAAGSLSDLEKVDAKLAQINSFKFKEKFLGVTVDIEKTKEQLVAEVSDILTKMSSDEPGKRLGEALTTGTAGIGAAIGAVIVGGLGAFFGGPAGFAIGAQLGGAIGGGVGAWLSADTSVLEDAAEAYGDKVREKFSKELSQIADPKLNEKTLQGLSLLMSKYSELALVNPQARAALEAQAKMILQSAESTQFVEAFSQIMTSTGLTSDVISKNFQNITTEAQKASGYLSSFSSTIKDQEIKFTFVDQYSPEFKTILEKLGTNQPYDVTFNVVTKNAGALSSVIDEYDLKAEGLASSLTVAFTTMNEIAKNKIDISSITDQQFDTLISQLSDDLKGAIYEVEQAGVDLLPVFKAINNAVDVKAPVIDALAAADAAQQQSIRVTQALKDLNDGLVAGTISYEDYTKRIGDLRSGLNSLESDLSKARDASDILNSLLGDKSFTDTLS